MIPKWWTVSVISGIGRMPTSRSKDGGTKLSGRKRNTFNIISMFAIFTTMVAVPALAIVKLTKTQEEKLEYIWDEGSQQEEDAFILSEFGYDSMAKVSFVFEDTLNVSFENTVFKDVSLPNRTITFQ